jgi:uncharacterized protein YeaO (DUF488 family)
MIRVKRVYDPPARADGTRILIDRVWPRGLSKQAVAADEWLKAVAPSTALRRWFGHDPEKWTEFRRRYAAELGKQDEAVARLRALARRGTVTLVYGARDTAHNNAVALKAYLERRK